MPLSASRPHKPEPDPRVELDRARLFFSHTRGNMRSMLLGVVMVCGVLHAGGTPPAVIGAWAACFALVCAGVIGFERHVQRRGLDAGNHRRLLHIRIALGGAVSVLYGGSALLLPGSSSSTLQEVFMFIVLSTVATVGALSFAVMPLHAWVIALCCFVPLLALYGQRYAARGDDFHLLMGAVVVAWLVAVMSKAQRVSATAIQALVLNHRLHDEIEEHKRTRALIEHMALHDPLTGLGNRRQFDEALGRAIGTAQRDLRRFGLLSIDLNQFKPVNDRYGHAVGDALLRSVAQRLQSATRNGDLCARMGGDEFAVLVGGVACPEAVAEVAAKLEALLEPVHLLGAIRAASSASVGWAVYPDDGRDAETLMAAADASMYRRKASMCGQPGAAPAAPAVPSPVLPG